MSPITGHDVNHLDPTPTVYPSNPPFSVLHFRFVSLHFALKKFPPFLSTLGSSSRPFRTVHLNLYVIFETFRPFILTIATFTCILTTVPLNHRNLHCILNTIPLNHRNLPFILKSALPFNSTLISPPRPFDRSSQATPIFT